MEAQPEASFSKVVLIEDSGQPGRACVVQVSLGPPTHPQLLPQSRGQRCQCGPGLLADCRASPPVAQP